MIGFKEFDEEVNYLSVDYTLINLVDSKWSSDPFVVIFCYCAKTGTLDV
jgi:hypothetical protein